MKSLHHLYWILLLPVIVIGWGCSTSKEVSAPEEEPAVEDTISHEEASDSRELLDETRSRLSDVHNVQTQDIPDSFLQQKSGDATIKSNPYDGFRVQILSTRNVEQADSVAEEFSEWADTTIAGYSAEHYVLFNQPHYKVHIGDFQQRDQANEFSQLVKEKYRDAWVVHDRIEPEKVPADTTSFSFKEEENDDEEENDSERMN